MTIETMSEPATQPVLASQERRMSAALVDLTLATTLFVIPWIAFDRAAELTGEDWYGVGFVLGFFFFVTIPALWLLGALALLCAFFVPAAFGRGRTLGKAVFGIAVCDAGGIRANTPQLLRREWFRAWRLLFVVPAVLDHEAAGAGPLHQARHDQAAHTIVVRAPRNAPAILATIVAVVVLAATYLGLALGHAVASD